MRFRRSAVVALGLTAAIAGLTACGGNATDGSGATESAAPGQSAASVEVVASFYPLAHAVEKVGGDRVAVTNLTEAGQDPHHVELTPQQVGAISEADLVVFEKGMQPAADGAVESSGATQVLDLSTLATIPAGQAQEIGSGAAGADTSDDHAGESAEEHAAHSGQSDHAGHDDDADHADHAGESAEEHAGHDHGPNDPHFWLDPTLYAKAAEQISTKLAEVDPEGASEYQANAAAYTQELTGLDERLKQGLANCTQKNLVTGHTALAYFANRYGFEQVGLSGVLNESEPDPARLAEVTDFVKSHNVTTIYGEQGEVKEAIETVAAEVGANAAVLDTVAMGTADSSADGYVERMESNLPTLRTGQGCS